MLLWWRSPPQPRTACSSKPTNWPDRSPYSNSPERRAQGLGRAHAADFDAIPVAQDLIAVAGQQRGLGLVQRQQSLGDGRHGGLGAAYLAVVDLQCHAQAQLGQGRAVHAFGADLAEDPLAQGLHHQGVEARRATDHEGGPGDGLAQALGRAGAFGGQTLPGADTGEGQGQCAQCDAEGRDGAAVGAARRLLQVGAGDAGQRCRHLAHDRMLGRDIAARELSRLAALGQGQLAGEADKAGVLAGAVVVQGAGLLPPRQHAAQHGLATRPLRAAFQGLHIQAQLGQQAGRGGHVFGLAAVRGAGNGQLGIREVEAFGGPALHQGQGLQYLDGRARKDRALDVTEAMDEGAVGIDDGHGAAVARFDMAATQHFDKNRVVADAHGPAL
eukprot:Opistho-1_new@99314